MNWAHRQCYAISPHVHADDPLDDVLSGPICKVYVHFEYWHNHYIFPAYAFIDGGCDASCMSLLWIAQCRHHITQQQELYPSLSDERATKGDEDIHWIAEKITITIAGKDFILPNDKAIRLGPPWHEEGACLSPEDNKIYWEKVRPMPGCEDLLLGRNFLRLNNILLVDNASAKEFCLLCPSEDNPCHHQQITDIVNHYPLSLLEDTFPTTPFPKK